MCSSGFFASSEKDTRLDKVPGVVVASESVVGASDTLCSSSQGVRPGMPSALAARLTARRADLLRSLRGRAQLKLSHAFHVVAIARSPAPKAIFLLPASTGTRKASAPDEAVGMGKWLKPLCYSALVQCKANSGGRSRSQRAVLATSIRCLFFHQLRRLTWPQRRCVTQRLNASTVPPNTRLLR